MPDRSVASRSLLAAVLLLIPMMMVGARTSLAADKVAVCHYQPDNAAWKLISVGGTASDAHLQNHDDALPGGVTGITGTALDANCEPVLASCGNCLTAHGGLGCDNADCESAVCASDSFCCGTAWDAICAGEAVTLCANIFCRP